jgi:HlyD family secretion protein
VHAAELAVQVARHELELARASLLEPLADEVDPNVRRERDDEKPEPQRRLQLRSPIDGRVLRVFEESARSLLAGTPILEVGDTDSLEIVADYLTQDAVLVRPGMPVRIEGWGGASALHGRVRVVEPGGYTKISALGVEEQRVDVVVDPAGDPADWKAFGDGYRVELRIVVDEAKDALLVPTGALFQRGGGWAAYVVEDGLARRRDVRLGKRGGLAAEVLAGLAEGEQVILYPSDLVADGLRVSGR